MSDNFYDKVAKKFGGYHNPGYTYREEFQDGDPEAVFKKKLLQCSGSNKTALDLGCADGRFTLGIAQHFENIKGIDFSKKMLATAKSTPKVSFEYQDANKTTFPDNSLDVAYSRRGPTPYVEIARVLKSRGFFVGIRIGERDCEQLKRIFGRGQGYQDMETSVREKDTESLRKLGFSTLHSRDYHYREYYPTYDDLDLFLQCVPIFEDYNSEKDKKNLTEYVAGNTTEKGIVLPRHRVVILAQKD